MTAPTTETLAGLLAKANMFGNHSEALAVARLSSLAPTLAAEVVLLRECREALATILVQANGVEPRDDALRLSVRRIARKALDAISEK